LLAFDYGTRRIGVAVGDTVTASARPLATVRVRGGRPDWVAVGRLVADWRPSRLVVGLPLDLDGGEQPASVGARRFSRQLGQRFGLPVDLADERLSSRAAVTRIADRGRRDTAVDPVAAQIILEGWFSQRGIT
jgi:putative Holliday junction resolvase